MQKIKIWDLPVRVFHWTLAAALAFMWFSAKTGGSWMAWHLRVGLLVAALLVFRLCWGIWGSDTARFARFFRPLQIGSYLRGDGGRPTGRRAFPSADRPVCRR